MGHPRFIASLSHVRGVRRRLGLTIPPTPETTQEKHAVLPHRLIYLDLRCHLPCIFPLARQLPTPGDCGPPFLLPGNVNEIFAFN